MVTSFTKRHLGNLRLDKSWEIRGFLAKKGINYKQIGENIGVSGQYIGQVVRGIAHTPEVLDALREVGVPEEWLFDPRYYNENNDKVA